MEFSVCEAPITAPIPTADVTHKYSAENAMEWASTFTQFVGLGSDAAAFNKDMIHPATKKTSAIATGSVLVCLSAARE
jgi:hypothetical protein